MALIVEDGTGRVDADSPNSIEELDDFCAAEPRMTGWASLSELRKDAAARTACRDLEREYRDRLTGRLKNQDQSLSFPRVGAWDARGRPIAADTVPPSWKSAHAELSYRRAFEDQAPIESVGAITEPHVFDLAQPAGKVLVTQGWAGPWPT